MPLRYAFYSLSFTPKSTLLSMKRNQFLKTLGLVTLTAPVASSSLSCGSKSSEENNSAEKNSAETNPNLFFKISLAEWSLNQQLFAGELTILDFPAKAKNDFGISAVEYVNQFF